MESRRSRLVVRQESFAEAPVPNPFERNMVLTRWEKLQVLVASITIVPIRIVFMTLFLLLTWPVVFLATYGLEDKLGKEPLTGWRRDLRGPLRRTLKGLLWATGIPIRTKRIIGKRAHPSVAPILVAAPHASLWDGCAACLGCGLPSFVAARFNKDVPILGRLIEFLQPIYVTREDPNSRRNVIQEIIRRTHSGGEWPQIVIFPEGTTTNGRALITFKQGPFIPAVPVQPVLIRYPNQSKLDTVTWTWSGPGAWKILWLTLCQLHTRVEVEFLPVYHPSEEEKNDPKLYAKNVRRRMADALGIPVTDHTYDDCRLMTKSLNKNLPHRTGLVEFTKLHDKLGLSWNQVSESLDKFADIARNKDGRIGIEEFADSMGLPVSPALSEVFDLYDRNGSGSIDFREYVIGLSLVSQPANSDETLRRAFEIFDQGKKGYITFAQGKHILESAFEMSEEEVLNLFKKVDKSNSGKIYYEEFAEFIREKPEYARLFLAFERLKGEEADGKGEEEEGAEAQSMSLSSEDAPEAPNRMDDSVDAEMKKDV